MLTESSMSTRGELKQRANVIMLVLNVVGAFIYIRRASLSWVIPQERGLNSTAAESFIWALAALPIFAVFLLLNSIWGVLILRRRQWSSGRIWLLTVLIWFVAFAIDFAHH
jgi:hypothetical protein